MSEQQTFDPFMMWKEYYSKAESYWSKALDETMHKEEYSEWMGKVLDLNLQYKNILDKTTREYLKQMNIPSKDDLANVSRLIVNLDAKMDDIDERLDEMENQQISSSVMKKEITNLKKEMKGLDEKISEVIQLLKTNETKTTNNSKEQK